jgi:hypothetical protein
MEVVSPADRVLRLARAIVFTTVCIVVTAAGHAFAGGDSSTPWVLFVGVVATLGPAYVLSGREHHLGFVLGATVAAQAFLHELFTRNAPIPVHQLGRGGMIHADPPRCSHAVLRHECGAQTCHGERETQSCHRGRQLNGDDDL